MILKRLLYLQIAWIRVWGYLATIVTCSMSRIRMDSVTFSMKKTVVKTKTTVKMSQMILMAKNMILKVIW